MDYSKEFKMSKEKMMGRDEIKLRIFVFYINAVIEDSDKFQKERSPIEFEIQNSQVFGDWVNLRGILRSIVEEGRLENNSRVRSIKRKFDFEMGRTIKRLPEKDFFLHTFLFYLLMGCDFSRISSSSEIVKKLCSFDFSKILSLIEKHNLRNSWGFSIASRRFRESYWENLDGVSKNLYKDGK